MIKNKTKYMSIEPLSIYFFSFIEINKMSVPDFRSKYGFTISEMIDLIEGGESYDLLVKLNEIPNWNYGG